MLILKYMLQKSSFIGFIAYWLEEKAQLTTHKIINKKLSGFRRAKRLSKLYFSGFLMTAHETWHVWHFYSKNWKDSRKQKKYYDSTFSFFFPWYRFVVSHDHFKSDLCNPYLSWKQIHSLRGWTTWGEVNFSEVYPRKAAIHYCY